MDTSTDDAGITGYPQGDNRTRTLCQAPNSFRAY